MMKVVEKCVDGSIILNLRSCPPRRFIPYNNISHCYIELPTENGEEIDNIELVTKALNLLNRC